MVLAFRSDLLARDVAAEDVRLHPVHEDEDAVAGYQSKSASINTIPHRSRRATYC